MEKLPDMEIPELEQKIENKKFSYMLKDGESTLGRIVGVFDYSMGILRVEGFTVESAARGKGIGRTLLQEVEKLAIEEGCSLSLIETVSFSAPGFYEKQGYSILGEVKDYPMPGESFYCMVKRLVVPAETNE